MFFLSDYNVEFGRKFGSRDKKKRVKKGQVINAKTYVKGGWFGLGLKKGAPLKFKSTGNDQQDAIKLARAFSNREKKAGRM